MVLKNIKGFITTLARPFGPSQPDIQRKSTYRTLYNDITKHLGWRHSVGRFSCAVRVPLHAIAIFFQTTKIVGKTMLSPIANSFPRKAYGPFSDDGLKKDMYILKEMSDRFLESGVATLVAPPRQYRSLQLSLAHNLKNIFGLYHFTIVARNCIDACDVKMRVPYETFLAHEIKKAKKLNRAC
jgi:hypothetical protein